MENLTENIQAREAQSQQARASMVQQMGQDLQRAMSSVLDDVVKEASKPTAYGKALHESMPKDIRYNPSSTANTSFFKPKILTPSNTKDEMMNVAETAGAKRKGEGEGVAIESNAEKMRKLERGLVVVMGITDIMNKASVTVQMLKQQMIMHGVDFNPKEKNKDPLRKLITQSKERGEWHDNVNEELKNKRLQDFKDKYNMPLPIEYKSEGGTGESIGKPEPRARSRSQSKEKRAKEPESKERARSRPKQKTSGASSSNQPMEGGSGASSSNQPQQQAGSGEMEDDDEIISRQHQSP